MTLDLSAALEQIAAMHDENMRLAEIDCERCNHHALIVVRFDSPESVKCPKCGELLDLLNDDEIAAEVETRKSTTDRPMLKCQQLAALVPDGPRPGWISKTDCMVAQPDATWDCHFCGIAQPAWAGDCLTCEHTDTALEDERNAAEDWRHCRMSDE